ncbi:MAG: hypothetical protein ACOX8A_11940 [Thermacetogeniaceae bacterium]
MAKPNGVNPAAVETLVHRIAAQDFVPTSSDVETLLSSIVPGLQRAKSAPNVQVS